jgi:hypothetical protein
VQVRILTGPHAGKAGVIASAGTPSSTWNVTLNATSATVNERPANLVGLPPKSVAARPPSFVSLINGAVMPIKIDTESEQLRRITSCHTALTEAPKVAHPSVAVALERSKKNEEMLDAVLEEVLFLSGRLRKLDTNPAAKKLYAAGRGATPSPRNTGSLPVPEETAQVNATVSRQADKIASLEDNIDVLAKEVYWLSNRLRELDPESTSLYARTTTATPRSPLTRESTLREFPVPEAEEPKISRLDTTAFIEALAQADVVSQKPHLAKSISVTGPVHVAVRQSL